MHSVYNTSNRASIEGSAKNKVLTIAKAGQKKHGYSPFLNPENVMTQKINPVAQKISAYDFSGKTVLIVDDILLNRILLKLYLKNTGAQMLFAENGREAVDMCIENPQIDIVLMDIQMPVMNGIEATHQIRKLKPGMTIIVITAFVHSEDKQLCFDAGCDDFISKPCSRGDFLKTVDSYFQSRFFSVCF